jgi:hypothetical protein
MESRKYTQLSQERAKCCVLEFVTPNILGCITYKRISLANRLSSVLHVAWMKAKGK